MGNRSERAPAYVPVRARRKPAKSWSEKGPMETVRGKTVAILAPSV
jgi:hypothetical protein